MLFQGFVKKNANNGGSLKGFLFMSFISFKQYVYA